MLPIVPDRHHGTCRLLPERFAMRLCPVGCQRVDHFPSFHRVHEHFRVVTGSHTATVPDPIAVHADGFRVSFLVSGVMIRRRGPVFGRRYGAEDERDEKSSHVEASRQFYTAGDKMGFTTFDSLLQIRLLWDSCSVGPGIARGKVHFAAAVTDNGRALPNGEG